MATPEGSGPRLGPTSALVLGAVVLCLALLVPRLYHPPQTASSSSQHGCCDIMVDTDVNAIKVMSEICSIILEKQGGFEGKYGKNFATGKLTKEIISLCRQEVNTTCGIDIATFLDQNVRLGKTYKQILDDIRSYNSSTCLKLNYGVAPGTLGVPHMVGKFWMQEIGMRQERPPHLRPSPVHPALRERGRAIVPPPQAPAAPAPPYQASVPLVQRGPMEGRPMPIGGMRPPMGGAGGVIPPPKTSVGFVMPLYTLCIVIFFLYTVFKMLFRRQIPTETPQAFEEIKPDPDFRRKVFTDRYNRASPETNKLEDDELDILRARLAETERAMERIVRQMRGPLAGQDAPPHPYTNGSVHHDQAEVSPLITKPNEFMPTKETTQPSSEDSTPVQENNVAKDNDSIKKESTPEPELIPEKITPDEKVVIPDEPIKRSETPIEKSSDVAAHQLRSSVEKEKATVKVLGMEMTAHCEGGQKWIAQRPPTPPVALPPRHPTPPVEVSSIYLEGTLPHQSRILVTDSETHTEELSSGDEKDAPIVLSGKMTLSVINDEAIKAMKEKDIVLDDITYEDDDFTTASAATVPKQTEEDLLDGSDEEIDEEVEEEEIEIDEEVEEEEEEEEEDA